MMADEVYTPLEPLRGRGLTFGGTQVQTPGSTLGGTLGRRLNTLKDKPQPINLEVVHDPNILANPKWYDEKGMWMYSTIQRYCGVDKFDEDVRSEHKHQSNVQQKYGLWKR